MFESKIEITLDNDSKALIRDLIGAMLAFNVKVVNEVVKVPEEEKTFDQVGADAAVEAIQGQVVSAPAATPIDELPVEEETPFPKHTVEDVFKLGMQKTAEGKQAFAVLQRFGVNSPRDLREDQIDAVCQELEAL